MCMANYGNYSMIVERVARDRAGLLLHVKTADADVTGIYSWGFRSTGPSEEDGCSV